MKSLPRIVFTLAALLISGLPARAVVTVFQGDLQAFTDVVGTLPVIDFDDIAAGTDIKSNKIRGITFTNPDGNTLDVMDAASTFTAPGFNPGGDGDNKLFATTGANVLSPGGSALVPGPAVPQKDSLRLEFDAPVRDFGIDLLYQSLDGVSFTDYEVRDTVGTIIASGSFTTPTLDGGPDTTTAAARGGTFFVGFHSDHANIARIDFIEYDNDSGNPDANIGYDTIRVVAACPQTGPYQFTHITDSYFSVPVSTPAIGATGEVVFVVFPNLVGGVNLVARSSIGGPETTVADFVSDGFYSFLGTHAINGTGKVAFTAQPIDVQFGGLGIFAGDIGGGVITPVADLSGPFLNFGSPSLNGAGTVVFEAGLDSPPQSRGIFVGRTTGGPTATLVEDSGPFGFTSGDPDINEAGTVAFHATMDAGGEGIFTISSLGGPITTVADTGSGAFLNFDKVAIDNAGTVAFYAQSNAGAGIFTRAGGGGPVTTVADSSGPYAGFNKIAVNNAGTIAFLANLTAGGTGIFTGADAITHRVIATGDALFCSTVTSLEFSKEGINDAGQIAFYFELADHRSGIAAATLLTLNDLWRRQYFGTPDNAGRGASGADPDGDGLVNLHELAFGLDPTSGHLGPARLLPDGRIIPGLPHIDRDRDTGVLAALFVRRKDYAAVGLTYLVIFSTDLVGHTSNTHTPTVIADDGVMQVVTVPLPAGVQFFQLQVTGS